MIGKARFKYREGLNAESGDSAFDQRAKNKSSIDMEAT